MMHFNRTTHPNIRRRGPRRAALCALALAIGLGLAAPARAHEASQISDASVLPVALSVAAPALLLSAGAALTVVAVQSVGNATVWVLERASDGARMTLTLAGQSALAVGTGVVVVAMATGWVLSAAGQALCFLPNALGAPLLYNEQVTR